MRKSFEALGVAAFVCLYCGCAQNRMVKIQPTPEPTANQAATSSQNVENYVVKKGDCLWAIAAKPSVYGDALQWPLLYKANRDQIDDPDLIQVRQDLNFTKNINSAEVAEAVKKAKTAPKYRRHPRKKKPLALGQQKPPVNQ